MVTIRELAQAICLMCGACGSAYVLLCVVMATVFRRRMSVPTPSGYCPPVTILKPLHGTEKGLLENLRSACRQDYPDFQVVLSVQRLDDPAIHIMQQVLSEFGPERVTLCIAQSQTRANGKIQNLETALHFAYHDILVISDSDVLLPNDYLRAIVAP